MFGTTCSGRDTLAVILESMESVRRKEKMNDIGLVAVAKQTIYIT